VDSTQTAPDRFFGLLLAATAVPVIAFTMSDVALPDNPIADQATIWVMFLGSSGHVAASFFFYSDSRMRQHMLGENRGRFLWAPLFLIMGTSALFSSGWPEVSYAIMFYWIWQTHHYTRQNHGILAFTGKAYGDPPNELERTAITLSGVGGVLGALTVLAPYRSTFLELYGWHVHQIALGTYLTGWLIYFVSLVRGRATRSGTHWMRTLMPVVLMLFYLPLFVFHDPRLAVGSYAMAHGLQYLVFMSYVAAAPRESLWYRAIGLVAFVALLGWSLEFLQRPKVFGDYRMAVFGAYLGVVMWHFLLDAGVWRLREPFQRGYMADRFTFLKSS